MASRPALIKKTHPATAEEACATENPEIARLAYEFYERRGREDGHDVEDWLEAEQIVRQRANGRYGRSIGRM